LYYKQLGGRVYTQLIFHDIFSLTSVISGGLSKVVADSFFLLSLVVDFLAAFLGLGFSYTRNDQPIKE